MAVIHAGVRCDERTSEHVKGFIQTTAVCIQLAVVTDVFLVSSF
jgi:hypothetical protein